MLIRNVGRWDRVARLAVALIAFYPVFIDQELIDSHIVKGLVLLFGMVNVMAWSTGYCPVYHLSRFSTYHASPDSGR